MRAGGGGVNNEAQAVRQLAMSPDSSSGRGNSVNTSRHPVGKADVPSLENVCLQVCCRACVRKAYRFYPWWEGVRHVLVVDGGAATATRCATCGARVGEGEYVLVFALCEDSQVATRCRCLLSSGR